MEQAKTACLDSDPLVLINVDSSREDPKSKEEKIYITTQAKAVYDIQLHTWTSMHNPQKDSVLCVYELN